MRNFFVPHSTRVGRSEGRTCFIVAALMSLDPVLTLHLTQKISTD